MDADQLQDWLELAERKLKEAFGARLLFLGLQGSRGRGEGRTDSDIDLVVILDRVDREDWSTYRAVLAEMPSRELACGFFSGAAQLANWDRADLFQFVHDTTPILGDLACVAPAPGRAEAARALHQAACGLYHAAGHNLLHGRSVPVLAGQYRAVAFALRAKHFLETGCFLRTAAELDEALQGADLAVLRGGVGLSEENLEERSLLLLQWAGDLVEGAALL